MKTSQWTAISAAVISMGTLVPSLVLAQNDSTIPSGPSGVMSAYPTVVQTGTKPTLTWNILYPAKLGVPSGGGGGGEDGGGAGGGAGGADGGGAGGGIGGGNTGSEPLVYVNPPGTLIPNETLYATVQIVGTGISACDTTQDALNHSVDARVSFNGGLYQQIFYGNQSSVMPAKKNYIKKMTANQRLDFGGRYVKNGTWSPFYTTRSSNFQVVALVNGQRPPTTFPLYQSPNLASYLKPYLDSTGKVKIGPLSVLIMMELGQTNRSSPCYDLQDQVLLVTFSRKHPNSGHGNNLDGVDSSNPGNGRGGPNGMVDPSGGVDDEIN